MSRRTPVRAAVALAGAGSLGTFLSAAARTLLLRLEDHNAAVAADAPSDDPRWLNARWGHVTVDALSGTSAGAITACQIAKALFEPTYLGRGAAVDAPGTLGGDWVHGAQLQRLVHEGSDPTPAAARLRSPEWTVLHGTALQAMIHRMLATPSTAAGASSLLDPDGVVGLALTLTDLLGYHEPAEFDADRVLGHPDFGCAPERASLLFAGRQEPVRDMGSRNHGEIRRIFLAREPGALRAVDAFLARTRRRRQAVLHPWGPAAAEHLSALATASAALPLAVGPVAVREQDPVTGETATRLYMDGGVLNNKPVAPGLRMARWHDLMRLQQVAGEDGAWDPDAVCEALGYERVCFFIDAFPERSFEGWRNRHPDAVGVAWHETLGVDEDPEERKMLLERALETPWGSLGVFAESLLTSLRAQDLREIARTNARLRLRNDLIDRWIAQGVQGGMPVRLDSLARAAAWASVRRRPAARGLSEEATMVLVDRLVELDRLSNLDARRSVTLVPVMAPRGLRGALAGQALHAVGGLLGLEARRYDAGTGARVATEVLDAVAGRPVTRRSPPLPMAPAAVLPEDSSALVDRLRVLARAVIDGGRTTSSTLRFFARLPLEMAPLVALARERMDGWIRGGTPPSRR
jgi:predicted acylesterase/phospholipase RssA